MTREDRGTRALRWALGPCSGLRLKAFRWALTLALLIYTLAWALEAHEWLTAAGYHISPEASHGLARALPLLPAVLVPVFLLLYLGSMVAVLFDVRARLCSWVVFAGLAYATMVDRLAAFSMNKIALVAWAVLLLAPWLETAAPPSAAPAEPQPAEPQREEPQREELRPEPRLASIWPIRVLQATLMLQYLGAGICKLRGDWAASDQVLWLQIQGPFMTDFAAWMVRTMPTWIWAPLQHGALAFELAAPLLFTVVRLRPVAFVWGLAMHLAIAAMMYRVGFFSLSVVAFYTLFLDDRLLARLGGYRVTAGPTSPP